MDKNQLPSENYVELRLFSQDTLDENGDPLEEGTVVPFPKWNPDFKAKVARAA